MQEALDMTSEEMDYAAAELLQRERDTKDLGNNNHHLKHMDPQL